MHVRKVAEEIINRVHPSKDGTRKTLDEPAPRLDRINWLASFPKSGNTWVRFFLDAYVANRSLDLNEDVQHWSRSDQWGYDYQVVSPAPIHTLPEVATIGLRYAALLNAMCCYPGQTLLMKTHHGNYQIDGTALIPKSLTRGAIYIVRDPRDVAVSWSHHFTQDLDASIARMLSPVCNIKYPTGLIYRIGPWWKHVESWLTDRPAKLTVVRYEDLLANPKESFTRVLRGVGLEPDEERVEFAMREASMASLREKESDSGFKEKRGGDVFFRQGKSGKWREELNKEQVHKIERECGEVMAALGYDLETIDAGKFSEEPVAK